MKSRGIIWRKKGKKMMVSSAVCYMKSAEFSEYKMGQQMRILDRGMRP